jgi:hypothetical protein
MEVKKEKRVKQLTVNQNNCSIFSHFESTKLTVFMNNEFYEKFVNVCDYYNIICLNNKCLSHLSK